MTLLKNNSITFVRLLKFFQNIAILAILQHWSTKSRILLCGFNGNVINVVDYDIILLTKVSSV